MKKNENNSDSVYQNLIQQLLTTARHLSIQDTCLLWAFKGKANLTLKQKELLTQLAKGRLA